MTLNNITVGSATLVTRVQGDQDVGGIIGRSDKTDIINSISHTDVYGIDEVGGLVGSADNTEIISSTSRGDVKGFIRIVDNVQSNNIISEVVIGNHENFGGLIGEMEEDVKIINSSSYGDVIVFDFDATEFSQLLTEYVNRLKESNSSLSLADPLIIRLDLDGTSFVKNVGGLVGDIDEDDGFNLMIIENSNSYGLTIGVNINTPVDSPIQYQNTTIDIKFQQDSIVYDNDVFLVNRIGGLIGYHSNIDSNQLLITNSIAYGDVYGVKLNSLSAGNSIDFRGVSSIGGFIGEVADQLIIENSSSRGNTYGVFSANASGVLHINYVANVGGFIGLIKWKSEIFPPSNPPIEIIEEFRILNSNNMGNVYGVKLGNINNADSTLTDLGYIGGFIGRTLNIYNYSYEVNDNFSSYNLINNVSNSGNVYGIFVDTFAGELDVGDDLIFITDSNEGEIRSRLGLGIGGLIGGTDHIIMVNISNYSIVPKEVVGIRIDNYTGATAIYGFSDIGGLIGRSEFSKVDYAINNADVYSIKISQNDNNRLINNLNNVGGLVGYSVYDSINFSSSNGNVTGIPNDSSLATLSTAIVETSFNLTTQPSKNIGGLIGEANRSLFNKVDSSGDVSGLYAVGGLIGNAYAVTLKDSHSTSKVDGTSSVGGLVGLANFGEYYKVYYLNEASGTGVYNIKGLNDVGGLIGQGMHPFVENAYAKFNKIIATYNVGGLSGRIWNDYDDDGQALGYSNVNSFEYVYVSGIIDLNTVPTIPVNAAVGGLIGEVESVIKNAIVDVDITPAEVPGLAIGAVFGIVADPVVAQSLGQIDGPSTSFGKIYYDSNITAKVGSNELGPDYDSDIANITSKIIADALDINFLTILENNNWTNAAWDVTAVPSNTFNMWNLSGLSLSLSSQPLYTVTATLGGVAINNTLNPVVIRESNSDNNTIPELIFTLTLNSSYYSFYDPTDPNQKNTRPDITDYDDLSPQVRLGFSKIYLHGLLIDHAVNSNVMTITISAPNGIENSTLRQQFAAFVYVYITRKIPATVPSQNVENVYNFINLPTIMFEFIDEPLVS